MNTRWKGRGRPGAASLVIGALVAGTLCGTAHAAPGSGGGAANPPWPNVAEIAAPSGHPEVAQRQALGCTVVGLGVTGVAVASGVVATAGSAGSGAVPVGAMVGEIITYFGAGCTIGAFLANLYPVMWPPAQDVGARDAIYQDIGG